MTLSAHFETDAQQRHKSEAVALGSEYYAHIFFFQTSAIFRGQWQTFKSLQPHKRGNTKVLLSWHISANNPSKQKQTGQ